ncbi:hypothetical protein AC739_09050 [Planococcus glaciei]|uniref:DUF2269 family protein n=3 Tax=Planococcus glaciei TaxID=459472 RepID=A0A7H8QD80_9BACL|nr:hypothetical protein [Planococcus glaciei]KOF10490.1 hypothetical protein AC739_09050 [Planococcus glaciei]MBX0316404.1 hypothetical protein [Planococcus glaciei]QDY45944.1 hypothetical protein FK545_12305 [Planococcus glaciei]QKX51203.1 hypothetical protein HF394_11700 [Planococcus glaciei]
MLYNVVLFLHILGAVIMFMAISILALSMLSLLHAKETEDVKRWSGLAVKTDALFPLSTLIIIVPALYLVFSTWGWGIAWINVSLAALLGTSFLGPVINLRRLKGILAAAEAETDSVPSSDLVRKVRDPVLWNSVSIMSMLVFGILFLMAVKLPLVGSLITMAIALVAGLVLARFMLAKTKPDTSADTVSFR